jgi:outer membrane protein OmpA-like peptidoglycan-associated protein
VKPVAYLLAAAAVFCLLTTSPVAADGRPIAGVDIGVMVPLEELDDFVTPGGVLSPFFGYMFNDYLGVMGQLQVWGAESEESNFRDGFRSLHDDNATWAGGGFIGPRLAVPMGPVELYGTVQGGIMTALADEALTDTSAALSTGIGLNFALTENLSLGAFGRWNRLYQRVHGRGDAKYITTGLALTYQFTAAEPPPPPPPAAPKVAAPPPPPPPVGKKIVLRGVNFDFDKSNIRADARPILDEAISTLQREGGVAVITEGHTDAVGTDTYNQQLSLRRARAVRDYLVRGGITESRIRVEGFGESRPVATNETADGRAQNRRVELRVTGN